jgi:hypothetical protein
MLVEGIIVCLIMHITEGSHQNLPIRPFMTPALLVSEIITIISTIQWSITSASCVPIVVRYCDEGCIFFPLYKLDRTPPKRVEFSDSQKLTLRPIALQAIANACTAAIRGNTREHRALITDIDDQDAVRITQIIRSELRTIPANVYARRHCVNSVTITICFSSGLPYEYDYINRVTNDIIDREVTYDTQPGLSVVNGHLTECMNIYNVSSDTPPRIADIHVINTQLVDYARCDTFDLVMRDIMITSSQ